MLCGKGDLFLLGSRCNGNHEPSNFAKPFALRGRCSKSSCRSVQQQVVLRQLQDQLLTKTLDDEIRYFKEWSWQLTQYLAAIDNKYSRDLDGLSSNATRAMDMSIASAATRDRNHKFVLFFWLDFFEDEPCRPGSQSPTDGFEGWRQLLLTLRPTTKSRGLAIMSAVMSWPSFTMNAAIQPPRLRLENSVEETKRFRRKSRWP